MEEDKKRNHFWIPDEEVVRLDKTPTGRGSKRDVSFLTHGQKLSNSLQIISESIDKVSEDDSLSDTDIMVFKVELSAGAKIKDKKELFISTGMEVKVVKDENKAVIATTKNRFQAMRRKIENYTRSGYGRSHFDLIENFGPFLGTEKTANSLQKITSLEIIPDSLDVQLMLLPHLSEEVYSSAIEKIKIKIGNTKGFIKEEPYSLSDNTPVIRAIIPPDSLFRYENDLAIYRIEKTDFFSAESLISDGVDLNDLELDDNINIDNLPIVAVLDSGVSFPKGLEPLVIDHWADGTLSGNSDHGTKVASRVAFRFIKDQVPSTKIKPRARIIDCNILGKEVPVNLFIKRIQNAVTVFHNSSKIFNLSANASSPIEGDEMSILGYELDVLQLKQNVQFIIPSGNHQLWKTQSCLEEIIDDDDSRIASPGDLMLSIVVGAVAGASYPNSLSIKK